MPENQQNPHNPSGLTMKQALFHPASVIAFLVVFFPIGLLLMWIGKLWPMWVRISLTVFFGYVLVIALKGQSFEHLPASQVAYSNQIKLMQSEYSRLVDVKNEAMVDDLLTKSNRFFNEKHEINGWQFTVQSIDKLIGGSLRITAADQHGYKYYIHSDNQDIESSFKRLVAGNIIAINGYTNIEASLTRTGAIEEPEIIVNMTSWAM